MSDVTARTDHTKLGSSPPPSISRLTKWVLRLAKMALVLLALLLVAAFAARTTYRIRGNSELKEITARLDSEDPGWRLDEIMTALDKAAPPDKQNSALVVQQVYALLPNGWFLFKNRPDPIDLTTIPFNHQLPPEELLHGPHKEAINWQPSSNLKKILNPDEPLEIGNLVESTAKARSLAHSLRNLPRGYRSLTFPDCPIMVDMNPIDHTRNVISLLQDDALHAAHSNDPIAGLNAAHAALHAGLSIKDEPILISQLARIACGRTAISNCVRVLGLTNSKDSLAKLVELQIAFLKEAQEPILLNALRGERAIIHLLLENVENGKFRKYVLSHPDPDINRNIPLPMEDWFTRGLLPSDHALCLGLMTKAIAVAKLPANEQANAFLEIEEELKLLRKDWWGRLRLKYSGLMIPSIVGAKAYLRYKAELVTVVTAIACERFRHSRGIWPKSLDELPKEILPRIPTDPYNGEPLKLVKLPDGIAIISVGSNLFEHRGAKAPAGPLGGDDVGWRLYDPESRGLPPLPETDK